MQDQCNVATTTMLDRVELLELVRVDRVEAGDCLLIQVHSGFCCCIAAPINIYSSDWLLLPLVIMCIFSGGCALGSSVQGDDEIIGPEFRPFRRRAAADLSPSPIGYNSQTGIFNSRILGIVL